MDVSEQSYTANNTDQFQGGTGTLYIYGLGFFFGFFILIIIFYITYICKTHMCSGTPVTPPPPPTTTNNAAESHHEDVIMAFPTFVYSELVNKDDVISSGCAICLADYKPVDVIRLLPECGHLFHCMCIDTWLRVHPTCPVCRKSMLADIV